MGERLTLVDGTSTIKNPQLTETELRGPPRACGWGPFGRVEMGGPG